MSEKRCVFVHPGGLHQIIAREQASDLAISVENFETLGRCVPFASLYRVTARVAYYREPITPALYSFHAAQQ